ncbi:hypothetical protein C2G38_2151094 [Gigaspora rosea]|uniref:Uncharacterized protein n=1 Tax=Gigaspora rosea TaxID=44941 RepID=A0A397W8E1_9GLOM|nr:hypothetical protein C2G38_2151094 [Gigaspora rosea]
MSTLDTEEQLRLFGIDGTKFLTEFQRMNSALECHINSLQGVRIDSCAFNEEFEVLKNCKKLEMLRIRNCDQELSKLSKILDLKSGTLLQRLSLELNGDGSQEYTLLLEALKSFCPNIIYLDIANIKFFTKLVELTSDLQKLQFFYYGAIMTTYRMKN